MSSHELARQLLNGPDLPVHFSYNYGDYWKTEVAPEITEIKDGVVEISTYHDMDKVVPEDDHDQDDEKQRQVIILS